jgi:hypothetical protein
MQNEDHLMKAFDAIASIATLARECYDQRELVRALTARVKELTADVAQKPVAAARGVPE